MEVNTLNPSFNEAEYPVWEKIGAVVRFSYGIGIYGAMALAGRFICSMMGIDIVGGFELNLDAIVQGLGYAAPNFYDIGIGFGYKRAWRKDNKRVGKGLGKILVVAMLFVSKSERGTSTKLPSDK
ncbi:hypothetical protein RchiOBHm_Chr6g0284251 [Rosa chinensis]|uniref:Uncharacterized protein n=1 Tax=Rosa chinensis TaxID=74649 RepID=A0A2P6PU87_ROSCH|nr:uncharacterized protein LOC112169339 [Rosa chinensis]PRQ25492.1 hypothetical protein RchiOBHm_Chr6g0284251 [Rosa chinensis]